MKKCSSKFLNTPVQPRVCGETNEGATVAWPLNIASVERVRDGVADGLDRRAFGLRLAVAGDRVLAVLVEPHDDGLAGLRGFAGALGVADLRVHGCCLWHGPLFFGWPQTEQTPASLTASAVAISAK